MNSIAFGLPLHPLVVHVAVVLLPLAALGLIAAVISTRVRRPYGWLIMVALTIGVGAAIVAKSSGEQLAEVEPLPERHSDLGNLLVRIAIGLVLVAWAWWLLWRRRDRARHGRPSIAERVLGVLTVPLALAAVVFTGLTGHAGAQATWGEEAAAPNSAPESVPATPAAPAAAQSPSASPTPGPVLEPTPTDATYSLQEVAEHDSAASCWVAIDGAVYDVTSWIERHPGGRQRILNLCGTDGTGMFRGQHGSAALPNDRLAGFRIGQLG